MRCSILSMTLSCPLFKNVPELVRTLHSQNWRCQVWGQSMDQTVQNRRRCQVQVQKIHRSNNSELKIVTCEFNPWIMQLNSVLTWTKDSFREHEEANRTNLLSLLLPVSLSTTVDFTMLGVASWIKCVHSSGVCHHSISKIKLTAPSTHLSR